MGYEYEYEYEKDSDVPHHTPLERRKLFAKMAKQYKGLDAKELTQCKGLDAKEFTDIIYDTLMKNTQHRQLDLEDVEFQEVDAKNNKIFLTYCGRRFNINIEEVD